MRDKLLSLPLAELRSIAKHNGISNTSTMRKNDLVDAIMALETSAKENTAVNTTATEDSRNNTEEYGRDADRTVRQRRTTYTRSAQAKDAPAQPERQDTPAPAQSSQAAPAQSSQAAPSQSPQPASSQPQQPASSQPQPPKTVIYGSPDDPYRQEYDPSMIDPSGEVDGILEVMQDGYGFVRCANYMPGDNDVYVSPMQIKKYGLKTGDIIVGAKRLKNQGEKFSALLYMKTVNGYLPNQIPKRVAFEKMTPIFPDDRIHLATSKSSTAMRIVDLMSPIGKGQRGMIVSPPKAGKTTLLKQVAKSITMNHPDMHLIILLIDERPEEVTDIKESIEGNNVEVIYSTFDELPEHHKRVSEMVIERAKRLVEHKQDVCILLDSITRLTRAYNIVIAPSGRTLSGGLDPAALHMPKKFFGAARNMREGGSLTILATALVDTGSKMDDVVFEEFKGTGNMELVLDRKLSEKRIFPAIDIAKSGTRREDLLLTNEEQEAVDSMRKALNGLRSDEAVERILDIFTKTRNNDELCQVVKKTRLI